MSPSALSRLQPVWHRLGIYGLTTLGCAWLYSTIYRESFAQDLVYSACVVAIVQCLGAGGRYLFTARLRRQGVANEDAAQNWPGWKWMLPWLIVSVVIGYFAGIRIGDLLLGIRYMPIVAAHDVRMVLVSLTVALAPAGFVTYVLYARNRMAAIELRAESAQRTAAESQLRLLESQLEPHMLFNTLANLRVLIAHDPQRAQGMLDHLIAFLRATLAASRAGAHPLAAEFARTSDYLALMQIRMGPRLKVQLDLPEALSACQVPPLLLQPLVENAIRHGLEPKVSGGRVVVSAARRADDLVLTVHDTGVGLDAPSDHGARFGLQQVRERLATLYGPAATLDLRAALTEEGGTLAVVTLPCSWSRA
ncbi:sensor histidine kinase [Paraburkholderia sp. BCC1886]|uniref:sensor histidine kinase n=1 Tax=Paraburkholderia sp. BCC1886 TaxID=2562670 RepID=UPI0021B3BA7A|nr:histidine kinase [Paraburkholderia sp. BCC1886]